MYNILTFENGQPLILYREKEKIYMYTISRGKVTSRGILFNNVGNDFKVYESTPYKISYISTDDNFKIYTLYHQHFIEEVSLSLKNHNSIIKHFSSVLYNKELYIFYLSKNLADNKTQLYYIISSTPAKSNLLKEDMDSYDRLCAFLANDKIYLALDCQSTTQFYYFDSENNLVNIFPQKSFIIETTSVSDGENLAELHRLNDSLKELTSQYDELYEYTEKLQHELRMARYRI